MTDTITRGKVVQIGLDDDKILMNLNLGDKDEATRVYGRLVAGSVDGFGLLIISGDFYYTFNAEALAKPDMLRDLAARFKKILRERGAEDATKQSAGE